MSTQIESRILCRHNFPIKPQIIFFSQLNQFSWSMSSVDAVLDEAGVRDLEMLTQDVDRSKRISQALSEQNKIIAIVARGTDWSNGLCGLNRRCPCFLGDVVTYDLPSGTFLWF